MVVVGKGFETAARSFARAYRSPLLRLLLVDDTVAHQGGESLMRIARQGVEAIAAEWRGGAGEAAAPTDGAGPRLEPILPVPSDFAQANQFLLEKGVTDGLPVLLPTRDVVACFVAASGRRGDEVIARLMPRMADITVEVIAANAIMAGCTPEMMPILITVVRAMEAEEYSINHVVTTAHTLFPIVVVNGPIAREVGMSDGRDLSAKGWRANAAIGRAVRLIMFNCIGDLENRGATCQGHFAKYFDAITENVEMSPWEPLHVERGYRESDSVVTVFTAEPIHMVDDHSALSAQGILGTFGTVIACSGTRPMFGKAQHMLIFGPSHATKVSQGGFDKRLVRDFIYEVHRVPVHMYPLEARERWSPWKQMFYGVNTMENATIPVVEDKEDLIIVVHGGAGPNSLFAPGVYNHRSVTREIE
ncbi:MAG: hypothetical protein HYY66_02955 [Candidatus Tectomicrobia bacterium]|nr:hypothetical protein [Candidatus Tectomicrobia bacterium]